MGKRKDNEAEFMRSLRVASSRTMEGATTAYMLGNKESAVESLAALIRELRVLSDTMHKAALESKAKTIKMELAAMAEEIDMIAVGVARHIRILGENVK